MADKKKKKSKGRIRKKVIRTANGLQVVWIDVATGKQVNDTNGWDIVSGNDADFPTTSSSTSTSSLEDELNDILGIDGGEEYRPTDRPRGGSGGGGSKVPYNENLTDTPRNTKVVDGGLQGLFDAAQSIGLFGGGLGMIGKLLGVKDNAKVDPETGEPIEQPSVADRIVEHFTGGGEDPAGDGEAIVETPTSVSPNSTNEIDTSITPVRGGDVSQTTNWNGKGEHLQDDLLGVVQKAQGLVSFPININSGYRDPNKNKEVGGANKSEHLHGNAVDVSLEGLNEEQRTELVRALAQSGALRLGAYSGNTAIHVDMAQGFDSRRGKYSAYPMFDKSIKNMGNAPSWFTNGLDGARLTGPAPTPATRPVPTVPPIRTMNAGFEDPKTNTGNFKNAPSPELQTIVGDLRFALTEDPRTNTGSAANFGPGLVDGARNITTQGVQPAGSVQMTPGARPSNIPDNSSELQLLNKMNTDVSAFPEERRGNTGNAANYAPPVPPVDPIKKSYLDLINKREGSPGYNEAFNYVPFNDLSKHPNIYNKEHDTSAAGRYQINAPTWNEFAPKVGVTDFSPESQDKVAWKIAEENYKVKTGGGDLYAALKSGDPATIATAFTKNRNRWVSLPASQGTAWGLVEQFTQSVKPVTPPNPMPYRPATSPTNKTYYGLPTNTDGSIKVQEQSFSTATGFTPKDNSTPAPEFAGSNSATAASGFAARPSTRDTSGVASEGSSVGGGVSNHNPSKAGWSNTPPRNISTNTGGAVGGSRVGGSVTPPKSTGLGAASTAAGGVTKPSSGFGTRPTKPGEY